LFDLNPTSSSSTAPPPRVPALATLPCACAPTAYVHADRAIRTKWFRCTECTLLLPCVLALMSCPLGIVSCVLSLVSCPLSLVPWGFSLVALPLCLSPCVLPLGDCPLCLSHCVFTLVAFPLCLISYCVWSLLSCPLCLHCSSVLVIRGFRRVYFSPLLSFRHRKCHINKRDEI
jgi:hypothetical protein